MAADVEPPEPVCEPMASTVKTMMRRNPVMKPEAKPVRMAEAVMKPRTAVSEEPSMT